MLTATFGDLPSVDLSRQPDVGDQHVSTLPLAPRQRLFPIAGVDYLVPFLPQCCNDEFPDKRIIFHDKYAHDVSQWPDI